MPFVPLRRIGQVAAPSIEIISLKTDPNRLVVTWQFDATGASRLAGEVNVSEIDGGGPLRQDFDLELTGSDDPLQTGTHTFAFDIPSGQQDQVLVTALTTDPAVTTTQSEVTVPGPTAGGGDQPTDGDQPANVVFGLSSSELAIAGGAFAIGSGAVLLLAGDGRTKAPAT